MSNRDTVFKVIYKINGVKRTAIITAKNQESASKRIKRGSRIISISKVDTMGLFGLGDASKILLPDRQSLIGTENFMKKKFNTIGDDIDDG